MKLFTFLRVHLLNKQMPDSKKYIHVYTKSRIKRNKLANKKKEEKHQMILDLNPHLLNAKEILLSVRLTRNCDFFYS